MARNTAVENLGPDDFQRLRKDFQKTHKRLSSITTAIAKTRAIFNWAGPGSNGQGYFERMPRFGSAFKRPSKPNLDREREESGERVFTAEQVRVFLAAARPTLKAMIFLGINAGFGNTDCAKLPLAKVDLVGGWVTFPRTKNAIPRRAKLWPETVEAIRDALKKRKEPTDHQHANRVFITKYCRAIPWQYRRFRVRETGRQASE